MLYECHTIPIAIKNIVDKFLQNGQIIRILKSETPTVTLCGVSCSYPITIRCIKKCFYKRFFNSVKENLVVTRGQLYDLEEVSEGYEEEKRSTTKPVMLCKSIA